MAECFDDYLETSWVHPTQEKLYRSATQAGNWAIRYLETTDADSFSQLVGWCGRIEAIDGWWHHVDFAWPQRPGTFIGPVVGNTALSVLTHFSRRVRDRELNVVDFPLANLRRERGIAQCLLDADYHSLHTAAVERRRNEAMPNDDRDGWIYRQAYAGETYKAIKAALGKRAEWESIETIGGIKAAIGRYIERNPALAAIPARKRGRRAR